ncbi:MAG: hypothetical protein ACI8PG_001297 [Planctomycetota bacterium]|jgi:uncharacterized protein (DUF2132 family)
MVDKTNTENGTAHLSAIDQKDSAYSRWIDVMSSEQSNNPLHGLTLAKVVESLVEHYGWDGMAQRIDINCFKSDPSVKSSLKFLRKTQWARDKVEGLYISTFAKQSHPPRDNAK